LFESTINSEVMAAWIKQDLIFKLPKRGVVVMDNAPFHKQAEKQDALVTAGHTLLYLNPYLSDLNPIKKKWAHLKSLRCKLSCSVENSFQKLLTMVIC
jgi:transposase